MIDVHGIIGTVYNFMRNDFNKYLIEKNKETKPGLRVKPIDGFSFGGVSADTAKRIVGVYSNGSNVYESGWNEGDASSLLVVVDLFLLDVDEKLIYKYFGHLVNFLDGLHVGIERKVTDASIFQKQSGAPQERIAATLTIIIDTMEDDDE